jgi:hypothetical protein
MAASGIVYRLIRGANPTSGDFKSYRELYPERIFYAPECQVCGLSVYTDIADVERLKRRVPATRKKKVSYGELTREFGMLLHTPSFEDSHHSWWLPVGIQPWLHFKTLE